MQMTLQTFLDKTTRDQNSIYTPVLTDNPMMQHRKTGLQQELKYANAQMTFAIITIPTVVFGVFLMVNDPSIKPGWVEQLKNVLHILRPFFCLCLVLFTTAALNRKRIHSQIDDLHSNVEIVPTRSHTPTTDLDNVDNGNFWYPIDWIAIFSFGLVFYFRLDVWAFWLPVFLTFALLVLRRALKRQ
jgi:hypothetical protein